MRRRASICSGVRACPRRLDTRGQGDVQQDLRDAARGARSAAGTRRQRRSARRRDAGKGAARRLRGSLSSRCGAVCRRRPRGHRQAGRRELESLGYISGSESNVAPPGSRGTTRTAGSFNNEGVIQKERRKFPQAIEAFEKALTVDPNLASAQWNLSDVLYAMGAGSRAVGHAADPRLRRWDA